MADCYSYLGAAERFRSIAYENAAKIMVNMHEDVSNYKDVTALDALGGIGKSIAAKIIEYLSTGKIKAYEKLKTKVPFELLELMNITGFGPATLRTLHEQLQINTKEELIDALQHNQLSKIKGFGPKRISNMMHALKLEKEHKQRLPLVKAKKIADQLLALVKTFPGVTRAELAGSLRRKKETVGDIDLIITATEKDRKKIITKLTTMPAVEKVIAAGRTKVSLVLREQQIQADVRIVSADELGAAMLYFTGSKEHNIHLRSIAKQRGLKINEYGIFNARDQRLAGETEEEMYRLLGMNYIPPEKRLNKGEIEDAMHNKKILNKNR